MEYKDVKIRSLLFIRSCVYKPRLSSLPAGLLSASMQVWLLVLKPISWGVRQSLQGSAALSRSGQRARCHAIQIGWPGLQRRWHQRNQWPLHSLCSKYVSGSFYLPAQRPQCEGEGSRSSSGLSQDPAEQVSGNTLCKAPTRRNTNPQATPTAAPVILRRHLPVLFQVLSGFHSCRCHAGSQGDLVRETHHGTDRTTKRAHSGGEGVVALLYICSICIARDGTAQGLRWAHLKSNVCERQNQED